MDHFIHDCIFSLHDVTVECKEVLLSIRENELQIRLMEKDLHDAQLELLSQPVHDRSSELLDEIDRKRASICLLFDKNKSILTGVDVKLEQKIEVINRDIDRLESAVGTDGMDRLEFGSIHPSINKRALQLESSASKKKRGRRKSNIQIIQAEIPRSVVSAVAEPVYCTCRQPQSGDMIMCENEDCQIEWYHFSCVGLTKGSEPDIWICAACKSRTER